MTTGEPSRSLPAGTVTFLFTDIEGSTRLLQGLGPRYDRLLEEHRRIIRDAVAAEGGHEVNTEGDAFFVAFASATRAVLAAVAAQRALVAHPWPQDGVIRVRMGLHTGEAVPVAGDYIGLDVHRAARICAAGHGGQILLSHATRALIEGALPVGVGIRSLGERRLKDLLRPEHLFQVVAPDLPGDFPPLRTLDHAPNNLPIQLTSFVGRRRELDEAKRLLEGTRLLTLTGPGGTGKTRLSLQLGVEVIDRFPDGVYVAGLAAIADPALVPPTVGQALGLQETAGRSMTDQLLEYLAAKRLLLILDNFEQVLPAAPFVSELLRGTQHVKVLVTSRAALRVYGEQEFPVPPLALPDLKHLSLESLPQYEAVALFIQRAVAAKPDFAVTNENAPAVAEIASRLDGLPLAIELAAARVKLLPPQAMLARLQRRLDVLSGGARDLPARQQTLRNAIAWSYDLLDESSKRLLGRVGVFVGGCTLEEAEAVCGPPDELGGDVLEGLGTLADHSLLRHEEADGEPRFSMLETIREFAVERLEASGEAETIRRRHAATFLALAERAAPHLLGREGTVWLDRLEREHDNLRAALTWAMDRSETGTALRFAAALWRFWQMRGHFQEAHDRLAAVLSLPGARAHAAYAGALEAAGGIAYWQGDFAAARTYYEEQLAVAREHGAPTAVAHALYNLSFPYLVPKVDLEKGRALLQEALTLYEQEHDTAGIAKARWGLGIAEFALGRAEAAIAHIQVCIPMFRSLGDRFSLGWALHAAGLAWLEQRKLAEARTAFSEALRLFAEARDVSGLAGLLQDFSNLALLEGDLPRAARLAGGSAGLARTAGELETFFKTMRQYWTVGDVALDREALATDLAAGRTMSVDELVAYALEAPRQAPAASL